MKRKLSIMIFILFAAFGGKAFGGGFPVVDIASVKQLLDNWYKLDAQLKEMGLHKEISNAHYLQVMTEYAEYLQQIKSLYTTATDEEWLMFLTLWNEYYGEGESSVIPSMNKDSATYEDDLNVVLKQYGEVPREVSEIKNDADALGFWSSTYEQGAQEDYNNYNRHKDRLRMVSQNETEAEKRRKEIEAHARIVEVLRSTDSSDLRTLQEIAVQNVTLMEQLETIIEQQNQMLLNDGWKEAQTHAERSRQREYELIRLQNRKPTSTYGADRIGDF